MISPYYPKNGNGKYSLRQFSHQSTSVFGSLFCNGFLKKALGTVISLVFLAFSLHALPVQDELVEVIDEDIALLARSGNINNSQEESGVFSTSLNRWDHATAQNTQETTMDTNITSSSSAPRKLGLQDFNEIVQIHQADPQKHVVIEGDQDSGYKLVTKGSNSISSLSTEITVPTAQEVEENKKVRDAFFALVTRDHNISSEKLARIRGVQEESSNSPLSVGTICQVMKDLTRHKVLRSQFGIPSLKQPFAVFQEPDPFYNNITIEAMKSVIAQKKNLIDQELKAFREEYPEFLEGGGRFALFLSNERESDITSDDIGWILSGRSGLPFDRIVQRICDRNGNPKEAARLADEIRLRACSVGDQVVEYKSLKQILDLKVSLDALPEIKAELDQELEVFLKDYPFVQEILKSKRWFEKGELSKTLLFLTEQMFGNIVSDPEQRTARKRLTQLNQKSKKYRDLEIRKTAISQTVPLIESFTKKASAAYREDFGTAKFPHTLERYSKIGEKMVEYSLKYEKALLKEFSQKGSSSYWLNAIKYLAEENETETLFWVDVARERDEAHWCFGVFSNYADAKVQKKLFLEKQMEAGKSDPQIAALWSEAVNKIDGAITCFQNRDRFSSSSSMIEPSKLAAGILVRSADAVVQKITFLQQQAAAKAADPHNANLWEWNQVINKTDDAIKLLDQAYKLQIKELERFLSLYERRGVDKIEAAKNLLEEATALAKELSPSSDAVNNKVP